MIEYQRLVNHVLENGIPKRSTRGHVDTVGVFGYNLDIDVDYDKFPLLTTKKMSWKNIVIENMWFLGGDPHVDFLQKHGVHFWDDWIIDQGDYKTEVPSAYGYFWRNFEYGHDDRGGQVDQVAWALEKLAKNPNTRQACITSWDPRNVIGSSLPPCHAFHVLNVSGHDIGDPRLNLALCQRSCDIALGVPYNIAGYAFLMCLYARILGIGVGRLNHTLVDAHIYTAKEDGSMAEYDHRTGLMRQLSRQPQKLPRLEISDRIQTLADVDQLIKDGTTEDFMEVFKLVEYIHHGPIRFKAAV